MTKSLFEMVKAFYEAAAKSPEAQGFLVGKGDRLYLGRTYQFEVAGVEPFYIQINEGKLSVNRGVTTKSGWWNKVNIETDEETLRGVLQGRVRLVDAIEKGRWKCTQNEHWRGSHIPILTRIGQDIVRMKAVTG